MMKFLAELVAIQILSYSSLTEFQYIILKGYWYKLITPQVRNHLIKCCNSLYLVYNLASMEAPYKVCCCNLIQFFQLIYRNIIIKCHFKTIS